jgi:putative addiction module component (TIGR02574 family)
MSFAFLNPGLSVWYLKTFWQKEAFMPATMKSLGIDQLSRAERILLVEEIWDSIAAESEAFVLSESQRQDLQRRLDAYRQNPKAGAPWEDVRNRLQRTAE